MELGKVSKAIGAGIGSSAGGAAVGVLGSVSLLPAGSPAWAYVVVILGSMLLTTIPTVLATYFAPKNTN